MAKSLKKADEKKVEKISPGRQKQKALTHKKCLKVCELISKGRPLRNAAQIEGISRRNFYYWIDESQENLHTYTRAREDRAELIFDEILDIADDMQRDTITVYKDGKEIEIENKEWTARCKLRLDARKWVLSKMQPTKYGDKIEVTGSQDININWGKE